MARRTLTIKRIDPWSVLKVGFLANLVLLGILLLAGRVVWFFIDRLELIGRACEVATSVGFQDCGLNGGNIFRNALLLGLLGVVVQTGILVFAAFLHNLIAELTGGLQIAVNDDSVAAPSTGTRSAGRTGARPGPPAGSDRSTVGARTGTSSAATGSAPTGTPASGSPASPRPGPAAGATGPGPSESDDRTQVARPGGDLFGGQRPAADTERQPADPQRPKGPSRP